MTVYILETFFIVGSRSVREIIGVFDSYEKADEAGKLLTDDELHATIYATVLNKGVLVEVEQVEL